ncbi:glycosyltransferase family 2 protein [Apibacter sp. HY039]|uniref:glycosyltransferase family 2 protein n=1 Tax=Apibacter sp. HY039 TaxID=2501476 RepID=UPI000FEB64BD|nr:glycosyltransferase family 2 protein [Apibacter sp. HY039]
MLISIVVPVYNAEKFLKKCLDSIINQTYKNFELILINDGSTDSSLNICKEYAENDSRICIINQTNKGVSITRNTGINSAKGEYICFIDSDDWVNPDYLKDYMDHLSSPSLLLVQDINRFTHNVFEPFSQGYANEIIDLNDQLDTFLNNYKYTHGYPFNKFYNLGILKKNSILFPEDLNINEDEIFYYNYLTHVNKLFFLKKANYNYYYREDSLSRTANFKSYYLYMVYYYNYFNELESKADPKFKEFLKNLKVENYNNKFIYAFRSVLYQEKSKKIRIENLKLLNQLPEDFVNKIQPRTLLQKIDFFLLRKKFYSLLDIIILLKIRK